MGDVMNNSGSADAIVALSESKSRYRHQDLLLLGFKKMPGSTAKEVAAEVYDWKYERYADAPKRATDLAGKHLKYLQQCGNRKCRRSGKEAHTYRITERGIRHLCDVGLLNAVDASTNTRSVSGERAAGAHHHSGASDFFKTARGRL